MSAVLLAGCAQTSILKPVGPDDEIMDEARFPIRHAEAEVGELRVDLYEEATASAVDGRPDALRVHVVLANSGPVPARVDLGALAVADQDGRQLESFEILVPGHAGARAVDVPPGGWQAADVRLRAAHLETTRQIDAALLTFPYTLGDEGYEVTVVYERVLEDPGVGVILAGFFGGGDYYEHDVAYHHFHRHAPHPSPRETGDDRTPRDVRVAAQRARLQKARANVRRRGSSARRSSSGGRRSSTGRASRSRSRVSHKSRSSRARSGRSSRGRSQRSSFRGGGGRGRR